MFATVIQAIDHFYKKKDYDTFKQLCKKKMEAFEELKHYIEIKGLLLTISGDTDNSASVVWRIDFGFCERGEFKASFATKILISKVAPFFYIIHEFSVENKDKNGLSPVLSGFSGLQYSMGQYDLTEQITSILTKKGYQELEYRDMHEVVEWLEMPKEVTNFGPQLTIEHLLFLDLLGICNKK